MMDKNTHGRTSACALKKLEAHLNDSGYIFVDAAGIGRILMRCIRIHAYGTIAPSRSDSLAEITNSM